jgi:hypothetical protein
LRSVDEVDRLQEFEALLLPDESGHRMLMYHAVPGTPSDAALRLLRSKGLTPMAEAHRRTNTARPGIPDLDIGTEIADHAEKYHGQGCAKRRIMHDHSLVWGCSRGNDSRCNKVAARLSGLASTARGAALDLKILPLAITMMAGPQIMAAIVLVTTRRPVRVSLAFLLGVLIAASVGVAIARGIFTLIGDDFLNRPSGSGAVGNIIQYILIGLLIVAALRNYIKRATIKPPKWLETLMEAEPRRAFVTSLLVILLMPSDIAVMLTVGAHLVQHHVSFGGALPFIGATVLIAALPLLMLVLFHKRAKRVMPGVRTWMTSHSWLINIACCLIFIALIH